MQQATSLLQSMSSIVNLTLPSPQVAGQHELRFAGISRHTKGKPLSPIVTAFSWGLDPCLFTRPVESWAHPHIETDEAQEVADLMRQVPQPMDALVNLLHTAAHSRLVCLHFRVDHSDVQPRSRSAVDCCAQPPGLPAPQNGAE